MWLRWMSALRTGVPRLVLAIAVLPTGAGRAARSVDVFLANATPFALRLEHVGLSHGKWTSHPPDVIAPGTTAHWVSRSSGIATGTEGFASYSAAGLPGTDSVWWDNPFLGGNSTFTVGTPGLLFPCEGGGGNNSTIRCELKPQPAFDPPTPPIAITSLVVRIKTAADHLAGTDNAVYFDVGPIGWKLTSPTNQFEVSSNRSYPLVVPQGLTTDDILWLRLQKKGIGGWLNTSDGPDGAWKPEELELLVNGASFYRVIVNQWLDIQHPFWIVPIGKFAPDTPAERFRRSLRIQANRPLSPGDERIAKVTTPFKYGGISGWFPDVVPSACAVGTVQQAFYSTDGFTTIDLILASISVEQEGAVVLLDGKHGIAHQRFLRVESRFGDGIGPRHVPAGGTQVRVCGTVEWDSDFEGWHEIHPRNAGDIQTLP